MSRMNPRVLTLVCLQFLLIAVVATAAGAQQTGRVPVTIALVQEIPVPQAPYVILRRPDVSPHDVILLPEQGANPRMLSDAIRALLLARQRTGDRAAAPATLRVRAREREEGSQGVIPWTVRVLQDLRRTDPLPIQGVGDVSAVQIWLPRQN